MMRKKQLMPKVLGEGIAGSTTVSTAFLALVGMSIVSSVLWILIGTVLLAVAFEHQVNREGIGGALRRIFDKNHLALGIIERFLNELIIQQEQSATSISNNAFLKDYKAQTEYIVQLEAYIDQQEKRKKAHLFFEDEWKTFKAEIKRKRAELAIAKQRLRDMQLFVLEKLNKPAKQYQTKLEWDAAELLKDQGAVLKSDIRKKLFWIRVAGFFSIGIGTCAGFATLGAIAAGIIKFAVLGFIPFGGIFAFSLVAGIGYGLLMFQGVSDMIQEYEKHGKGFFSRRENESTMHYASRCFFGAAVIVLALGATIATAATWWSLVKKGSTLVGVIEKAADIMQGITISMMIMPYFLFNSHNSVKSVNTLFKNNYKSFLAKTWLSIRDCFRAENVIQFINPFRIVEKILSGLAKSALFVGHILSIGFSYDHVDLGEVIPGGPVIDPRIAAGDGALIEGLSDMSYLPDEASHEKAHDHHGGHDHKHESPLLTALYFPVALTVALLKTFSAYWDYLFSPSRDFQFSFKKMFTDAIPKNEQVNDPEAPVLKVWPKQEVTEVIDSTMNLLSKKLPNEAVKGTRVSLPQNTQTDSSTKSVSSFSTSLADHRNSLWQKAAVKPFEGKAQTLGGRVTYPNRIA